MPPPQILDNFLPIREATQLANEFPAYTDPRWITYDSPIENKKALNDWNAFPRTTYQFFNHHNTKYLTTLQPQYPTHLYPDPGLHGGGWHIHGPMGNLNPHLDYVIHPKLLLQRHLNLILYLSDTTPEQGGQLGFWEHNGTSTPGPLLQQIQPAFNRAVIFETHQCWHGLATPFTPTPTHPYRKSLAVYYLTDPTPHTEQRFRALFSARPDQQTPAIQKLIEDRAK